MHGGTRTTLVCRWRSGSGSNGRECVWFHVIRNAFVDSSWISRTHSPAVCFGSSCDIDKHSFPPSQHERYLSPDSSFVPFFLRLSANSDSTLAELPTSPRGNAACVPVHLPSLIILNMLWKSLAQCIFHFMNLYRVSAFVKGQEEEKKTKTQCNISVGIPHKAKGFASNPLRLPGMNPPKTKPKHARTAAHPFSLTWSRPYSPPAIP